MSFRHKHKNTWGLLCLLAIILTVWMCLDKSTIVSSSVAINPHAVKAQIQSVSDIEKLCDLGKLIQKSGEDITKTADMSGALDYVRRDMMAIRKSNDGAGCVNPKQKFNIHFPADGGFVLTRPSDKKDGIESWKVGLRPSAWGIESALTPVGEVVKNEITGNDQTMPDRLENHFSSDLTEWLVNRDEGVEQGFTIKSAPEGLDASNGKLLVSLKTTGGTVAVSTDSVGLKAEDGSQVVSYGKLMVADARGQKLPAKFISGCDNTSLAIEVNASGASFPVIIDPLATSVSWSAIGEDVDNFFGYSISTAGDVNGDGYGDIIVGASGNNGNTGKVYVFHGSATGITGTATSPAWSAAGEAVTDEFGLSISTAGDVNGDGYSDIIVGASGNNNRTGKVYVFHGSATGITGTASSPAWSALGQATNDAFGISVSTAGDVNGDGFSDIIVGAGWNDEGGLDSGKVYVFHGSASGITGTTATSAWSGVGEAASNNFGWSVSTAGDVNGDGYSDIIIGAYNNNEGGLLAGKAYVLHGSVSGVTGTPVSPAWSAVGEGASNYFGFSVSTAGDVNGDGYSCSTRISLRIEK